MWRENFFKWLPENVQNMCKKWEAPLVGAEELAG